MDAIWQTAARCSSGYNLRVELGCMDTGAGAQSRPAAGAHRQWAELTGRAESALPGAGATWAAGFWFGLIAIILPL